MSIERETKFHSPAPAS